MEESVVSPRPPKSGDKSDTEDLTPDEERRFRARFHEELEARILSDVLSEDECFRSKAVRVAAAEPHRRSVIAIEEAKDYAPYAGRHRDVVARLLLVAAEEPWQRYQAGRPETVAALRRDSLSKVTSLGGLWLEADQDALESRRVRDRSDRLRKAAQRVAYFGAHRCIECAGRLARARYVQSAGRLLYCASCEEKLRANPYRSAIVAKHCEEMRDVLDAATGQRRERRERWRADKAHRRASA